ncbi:hypothetical protein CGCTS75_v000439 [Colletotrichum tropicale]|nr:hypothetical protein CGCTS75_v000439 [Colletotrichum tropicale]
MLVNEIIDILEHGLLKRNLSRRLQAHTFLPRTSGADFTIMMNSFLSRLLTIASAAVGVVVTPGGTDYNAIKSAITAAAVKDSRLKAVESSLIAPTKRQPANSVSFWSAVGTFPDGLAGLETGVILTTGQAASAAPGITLDGSWGFGQDSMMLCPVAPSREYSIFCMNISAQSGVRALRVNYLFAEE